MCEKTVTISADQVNMRERLRGFDHQIWIERAKTIEGKANLGQNGERLNREFNCLIVKLSNLVDTEITTLMIGKANLDHHCARENKP